jgi:hypothetical protein
MADNASSFRANLSRGVEHLAESDIEAIRDLLRGYGSVKSILKELIQNAEDAEAPRLDFLYLPPDEATKHALARGPSLLVVNNGAFREEHRSAIFQINLGTKGTDDRAIGRFGKGLKSVFAWCEAFFIIAHTDLTLGWPASSITDLFNPWHGWRHTNWDEELELEAPAIAARAKKYISTRYSEAAPWLAFWFPLRHISHKQDSEGEVEWIFEGSDKRLPGHDSEFMAKLATALRALAPSLVNLRHLKCITMGNGASADSPFAEWRMPDTSQRIPAPDDPEQLTTVTGETFFRNGTHGEERYQYTGFAGRLPSAAVSRLEEAQDWPRVVKRTKNRSMAGCKAKGTPHFATLITSSANGNLNQGSLELRWCVFFPVGKQPLGTDQVKLSKNPRQIVVNLHGFFFLDSERLRIDGLETAFGPAGAVPNTSCVEWNRIIATKGTLNYLPRSFADFAKCESLTFLQCCELADAIRQTWVWSAFQEDVCRSETWRPRWQNGRESWECIPALSNVLPIPNSSDPRAVLEAIPTLAPISEEQKLAVRGTNRSPGLYHQEFSRWSETLVLRLLGSVQRAAALDEAAASWINDFLDRLHEEEALGPAVREIVSSLPLLSVTEARTKASIRISASDWDSFSRDGRLFAQENTAEPWLPLLCDALPEWSCFVASGNVIPRWFCTTRLPTFDAVGASAVTLAQTRLGSFSARSNLVRTLIQRVALGADVRLAIRYLMHASSPDARSKQALFVPSTQHSQQIWSRLIGQLLTTETGVKSWRLLNNEWGPELSHQVQQTLGIYTVDAEGVWTELSDGRVDLGALSFTCDDWSAAEVSALLKGLFEAGQNRRDATLSLLRRLKLHTQRGLLDERVSIGDVNGALDKRFVLDKVAFESQLPRELLPLWEAFLSETRVMERVPEDDLASTVQKYLFERLDADNTPYIAELDWNYVVRRSLASSDPPTSAPLIMEALSHGDQAARGIGQQLKNTAWLPLSITGSISPHSVVVIEGLELDLHRLLDPARDGLAGIRALPDWIRAHQGLSTLRKYFPDTEEAIKLLGLWLEEKPEWRLGLTRKFQPAELAPILTELAGFEDLPAAGLLVNLRRVRARTYEDGIDALLADYILPPLLKPFNYLQAGLDKLKNVLLRLQNHQGRAAFDAYLSQACADGRLKTILPDLSLVNQRGNWVSASQLTWPSTNMALDAQLCSEQASIIGAIHSNREDRGSQTVDAKEISRDASRFSLAGPPDFGVEVKKLREFLRPFRDGNIGDSLPAALVAVLGNHFDMLELLRELLSTALKQEREDFLALLLGDKRNFLEDSVRFVIEIVKGDKTNAISITGDLITVDLTRDVTTLIVGDPQDLWWYYQAPGHAVTCHRLRLRALERPDDLENPLAVFGSTIETILIKSHFNGVVSRFPAGIKDVLGDVADGGQADLRRSRAYLLDMAEARLKELGIRGVSEVDGILQKFGAARQARVDAELLATRASSRSKSRLDEGVQLVEAAKQQLVALLEISQDDTARRAFVQAVRRKMTDFQYDLGSVLFELFQNADDAVAELGEMQKGLDPNSTRVIVKLESARRTLEFTHWGRPINQHECPGFRDGLKRGYDQDLQKMLTLNFSDKSVSACDDPIFVTGRFGLGFKSVFFVSEQPEVISGRLAFDIRGGFFPVALSQASAEEMRRGARSLTPHGDPPTAIRLKWDQETHGEALSQAIDAFTRAAALLTVFSRQVRAIVVLYDGTMTSRTNVEQRLTASGRVMLAQAGSDAFVCFRCSLAFDQHPAAVLFGLTSSGISPLPQQLTGLWITTPTDERSELMWAVNAPFKPDAGRKRLALKNVENRKIGEDVARLWGDALLELFEVTTTEWSRIAELSGLHSDASHESWWHQLWKETAGRGPQLHWQSITHGGQVLSWLAWDKSVGAMRRLVQQRAAIPTELPKIYSRMVKAEDVRFCLSGLLTDISNGCFNHVMHWEATQRAFPPGGIVHGNIGAFLREAELGGLILSVTLEQVVASEIGPKLEASPLPAERLGKLFSECKAVFEQSSAYATEVQHLLNVLRQTSVLGEDCAFHRATELICSRALAGVIEEDEALRAGFAPDGSVLSSSYSDIALGFFVRARGQLAANAATLATWARQVSLPKVAAVFRYLIAGDLGQRVADQLGRPWLEGKRTIMAWQRLSAEDRNELERKFSKGCAWPEPSLRVPAETPELRQEMDADDAFRLVSQWWQREESEWVARYEGKTYPPGFPGNLPWPGEDGWDEAGHPSSQARWLILFVHASLVPLGFNMIGRDHGFSQFLVSKGWLDVLATVSENPTALLGALNQYLDSYIENTQFHFQMRQFVAFYAVAKNLEEFLLSLFEAERSDSAAIFRRALAPRANSALMGTGIDAPPLTGMLGTGSCQLFRELYRLKRLSNSHGHRFAFTPIRKVRRLCTQLFGVPEGTSPIQSSEMIFEKLNEMGRRLGLDPTFNRCFDLPLQFLAQDADLRARVLNVRFEAESRDDETLDSAPPLENQQ